MTTTPVDVDRIVISAEDLRAELGAGGDVVVLEVWRDAAAPGSARIPGVRPVSLTVDLVGSSTPASGNLPLPTAEQIQDDIRRWGINADSLVVAYSPEHPALAARAWWTLKWAGVPDVRVLDGDGTWLAAAGGGRAADRRDTGAGTFTVRIGSLPTLDAEQAAKLGISAALYPGSFSAYSADGDRPVAVSSECG